MMANFGTGWGTLLSSPPQLVYSPTLGFVPGGDGTLPSLTSAADSLPGSTGDYESVRVVIYGSPYGINYTIRWLYTLRFAQVNEWSFLMPAPNGDHMSIVTKRIPLNRIT